MGALHAACLKSAADGPRAGRYTDFSGARHRLQKWPKIGKNYEKIDFPYNNFPKKDISLRKCTKKKIAFGEQKVLKKSRLRRYTAATPPRGVLYRFAAAVIL